MSFLPRTMIREVAGGLVVYWLAETFWDLHFAPLEGLDARQPFYTSLTSAVMIVIPILLLGKAATVAYERQDIRKTKLSARVQGVDDTDLMVPEDDK